MDTTDNAYLRIHCVLPRNQIPIKIKITSEFSKYLDKVCTTTFQEMSIDEYVKTYGRTGKIGNFDSVPIEIDDTIENEYYELVYEEN